MIPLSIPSPSQGVWMLGPIPIRAYALAILAGIFVATWIFQRRYAGNQIIIYGRYVGCAGFN